MLQDPPDYYSEGNFMSYGNGVRAFVDRTAAGYKRGVMMRFHQHQLAASYQLAAFQHALAIARYSIDCKAAVTLAAIHDTVASALHAFSHCQQLHSMCGACLGAERSTGR